MSSDLSVAGCLRDLGITPQDLADCEMNLDQEFAKVKHIYHNKMRREHPDKGGDPAMARQNITAWEVLRGLKARGKLRSLTQHEQNIVDGEAYQAAGEAFTTKGGIPCYEYFYEASSVTVPGYKVEIAKTGRSQCVACKKGTGTCLKRQMEKAAKVATEGEEEEEESKKPKAKQGGGGGKKGKKKRGAAAATAKKEDTSDLDDETKATVAAPDSVEEEEHSTKPPPRKRGRKKKTTNKDDEEEEPAESVANSKGREKVAVAAAAAGDDAKPAMDTIAPAEAMVEDSSKQLHPPRRTTRARKAKSKAMTAIVTTTSNKKKDTNKKAATAAASKKKSVPKKVPAAAAAAAAAASGTAIALPVSRAAIVDTSNPNCILKDTIRVGSMNEYAGSYGRWHHLPCWRVPYRVWAGLTEPDDAKQTLFELLRLDEVLLTGLTALSKEDQTAFCAHVKEKTHWACKTKRSKPPPSFVEEDVTTTVAAPAAAVTASSSASASAAVASKTVSTSSTALAAKLPPKKMAFIIPVPGVDGAIPGCLEGQRFVLTGTFPEGVYCIHVESKSFVIFYQPSHSFASLSLKLASF